MDSSVFRQTLQWTFADVYQIVTHVRKQFERSSVNKDLLTSLYLEYHDVGDASLFIQRAEALFPVLNCGVASLYLRYVLRRGTVVRGSFVGERHTFLELNHDTIVDITADQFGGPSVYVGSLSVPWSK